MNMNNMRKPNTTEVTGKAVNLGVGEGKEVPCF